MAHARNIFLKARSHGMQYDQEGTIRFSFFMNDESWYILWISESLRYLILTEGVTRVWASQKIAVISGDKIWNSKWEPREMWPLGWCQVWSLHFLTAPVTSRCPVSGSDSSNSWGTHPGARVTRRGEQISQICVSFILCSLITSSGDKLLTWPHEPLPL